MALAEFAENAETNFLVEEYTTTHWMTVNEITFQIRGAIFAVHRYFGPGLYEIIYHRALKLELEARGLKVISEIPVPVKYKETDLELGFRIDLIVEDEVVIELKSVEFIHDVHKKQLLTYLKLASKKVGILVNFNEAFIKDDVSLFRIVNGF